VYLCVCMNVFMGEYMLGAGVRAVGISEGLSACVCVWGL